LWDASVKTFPNYAEYQDKTSRRIPVFLAEPEAVAAGRPLSQ
jgi:hypothetical protein